MATRKTLTSRLLAGTALTLVATLPAVAQDGVISLDPIVVENRDEKAGAADRATAVYVSDAELERARTGDLKDVFAGIASVSVGGALPLTQKIFVNGVDMLNLGVTVDGTAQNNRAFHHVSANAIDPGLLKQVRADATVSPADAGPYALAGSVVFETVDAGDVLDPGDSFGGNLRLSYGDNGSTVQSALTLAGREGGFEWLGYAKRAEGDNYQSGAGTTMPGTAAGLTSYLGKVAYEAATGHRFELSGQRLRDENMRQWRANFGGFRGSMDDLRIYDTTRSSYSLSYENTQAEGLFDPRVHVGYSESDIDVPTPYDSNGLSGTTSVTVENRFHLNASDTVTAGIDYQDRFGQYASPSNNLDLTEESRNVGLFAQARLEPTERLTLSFGGRVDRQSFTGVNGWEDTNTGWSGNASVSYAVTDALTLRGGVSSVFGGIAIEDNFLYDGYTGAGSYAMVRPSRANNASVGFDWQNGRLTLGGELFVTRIEDARNSDTTFDFESRGVNLGATYGWDTGFSRFTLSHSEVTSNGNAATGYDVLDFGTPLGTVLAFEIEQDTAIDGLKLGGGIDMALDQDMPASADANLDGYSVVNVFAEYMPPRFSNLTLRAEVNNLFDEEYADRATYGGEWDSIATLKEPGRTISLVAVTRF